ncbi:OLC1v1018700C1 [Oldenlandia corymbosa var. corymbosa]|uniref:OLC1v1018700C1 n=1 Tax=Oldenlandia corymbosa var. corymbosa TaxID=529605 RepID=A0AAV1ECA0_OLDCO|nr:OLC1v1018700C1 [Oldenlandia corymbosa var. corymbosa]
MADDYDSGTTIAPSEELKRNSEISATLNSEYQMVGEPPESSSSDRINKVVQEMAINPVSLPNHFGSTISPEPSSVKFEEEQGATEVPEVEKTVARASDFANDTVSLKQEGKGFEEELVSGIWENQERNGFEVEKVENDCAAPVSANNGGLVKQQLKCGRSDNVVLVEEESVSSIPRGTVNTMDSHFSKKNKKHISPEPSSVKFEEEQGATEVPEVEKTVARANDFANDTVSLKQEGKGFEEELVSGIWENQERNGFEVEKVENDCAAPVSANNGGLVKQQLKCGCSDNVVLVEEDSLVSGERSEFGRKSDSCDDTMNGSSVRCSLKIAVIDETALIETSEVGEGLKKERKHENVGNREKRAGRKGKSRKIENLRADVQQERNFDFGHTDSGIGMLEGFAGKTQKKVYSRKELERLRHVGLDWQRKKWTEIYCGLGRVVQQEFDGLVDRQYTNQKQKMFPRMDCNGRHSIFGEDKEIALGNPLECTFGLPPVNHDCGCSTEQENSEDDSDEDYSSIQKPAFFVSGEPNFDSGPPEDGLEYLRRVRWEAAQIPKVKVAKVDKSKLNKEQTSYMPQIPDIPKCPEQLVPLKEWEHAFLTEFGNLRLALSHYGASDGQSQSSAAYKGESSSKLSESSLENFDSSEPTPNPVSQTNGNSDCFIVAVDNDGSDSIESSGSKPSETGASVEQPTLSTLVRMDPVVRVSMLRKRINLAESMSNLSWHDCLWMFALSAAVDSPLDADTCASFRSLLRKCASLRAEKLVVDEEVAMLNILATISGRYFGQLGNMNP